MTAPSPTEVASPSQRKAKHRHKLCAEEARRAREGKVRETLCGKVMSGAQRTGNSLPLCPMCADLVPAHAAACRACRAAGFHRPEKWT